MRRGIRPAYLIGFLALMLVVVAPIAVRWAITPSGPAIEIVDVSGRERAVTLRDIRGLSRLCLRGSYENHFGNWRDAGEYCGVLLAELIGAEARYAAVSVVAQDGYRVEIERERVEDPDYPMVLAFSFDGQVVPDWTDGYRIAVLPMDGGVSNAEYDVESAGSYWVKNVIRLVLQPE